MRKTLLNSTTLGRGYRPSVRLGKHGHPLKGDNRGEHDSGAGGNNTQNNTGAEGGGNNAPGTGNGENQQNNTGTGFDAGSFWNRPDPDPAGAASGGSASGGNQGSGTGEGGQDQGNAFSTRLAEMTFGNPVFTPEAVTAMNQDSDPSTFNGNMESFGREVARQSVLMSAQLMQRFGTQMEQKFQTMMEERFGERDSMADLSSSFKTYNEPGMKPIIDGIYAQSMRVTKGDRKAAIEMTREMLKFQAGKFGAEFGLNTPPGGAGDGFTPSQTNWEEELLGRPS